MDYFRIFASGFKNMDYGFVTHYCRSGIGYSWSRNLYE